MMFVIVSLLMFAFFFLVLVFFLSIPKEHHQHSYERAVKRTQSPAIAHEGDVEAEDLVKKVTISRIKCIDSTMAKFTFFRDFAEQIKKIGIKANVFVIVMLAVVVSIFAFAICSHMGMGIVFSIMMSVGVGLLPFLGVWLKIAARKKKFETNFIEALTIIKNTIQSGQGLSSALKIVAQDAPWPVNVEFQSFLAEIEYGFAFENALIRFEQRMKSDDLSFFVSAVTIQRHSGGNLTQIIMNIEESIRSRWELKRELGALSAQGKFSGLVLVCLPVVLFFGLKILNPGYFDPLLNDPLGRKILWGAVGAGFVGMMWIRNIVNVKL